MLTRGWSANHGRGAFIVGVLTVLMGIVGCLCSHSIIDEVNSPDGRYRAVAYNYSCGATTPYYTIVEILAKADSIREDFDTAVYVAKEPVELSIEWTGPRELKIKAPSGFGIKRSQRWKDVGVIQEQ